MSTISFHTDITTSISHNNRINIYGNKDINLDKLKENIYYIQKDIKDLYRDEFGDAVNEYNSKQKRTDRKINNYYKKILNDKKTQHQRELIIAIGSKDENISDEIINKKKYILDRYMKNFQKRNPNLKVYNAVMHLDESNPHLHINYVPIANYKRGLKKRVSHENALKEQGLSFEQWRKNETNFIADLMKSKGIKRRYGDSHKHMSVKEYKELKEKIKRLKSTKDILEKIVKQSQNKLMEMKIYSKYLNTGNFSKTKVEILDSSYRDKNNSNINGGIYCFEDFNELTTLLKNLCESKNEVTSFKINIFDDVTYNKKINLVSNFDFKIGIDKDFNFHNEIFKIINPLAKNTLEKVKNFDFQI